MTGADLAALLLAVAALVVSGVAAVLALSLARTLRDLHRTVEELHRDLDPLVDDLRRSVDSAGQEVARVEDLLEAAEAISATVEGASRVGYLVFTAPLLRLSALVRGLGRGLRRALRPGRRRVTPADDRGRRAA